MKTGSKVLLGISGAVLLVAGSVAGTLAYLTSRSQVVNTFTMGKVDIDLTETKTDSSGTPIVDEETGEILRKEEGNEYRLVPGAEYVKDPMITVKADSEEAYIRMLVTIENYDAFVETFDSVDSVFNGYDAVKDQWVFNAESFTAADTDQTATAEFRYYQTVAGGTEAVDLPPLFTKLVIPGDLEGTDLEKLYTGNPETDFKITVIGHAIQANGFTSADAAWDAFDAQEGTTEAAT